MSVSFENLENAAQAFEKNRFIFVKNFLPKPLVEIAHQYTLMKVRTQQGGVDTQVPGTPSFYADTLMETILMAVTPNVERLTGKRLYPTYSYFRVYKNGDDLPPHIDRPPSEIGLTLQLGFDISNLEDPDYRWKIYMDNKIDYRRNEMKARRKADPSEGVGLEMNPGDCAIYHGCEVRHWRFAFEGNTQSQAFLMFVDRDGPYAKYRYDTRPHLGFPDSTIKDRGPHPYFPNE